MQKVVKLYTLYFVSIFFLMISCGSPSEEEVGEVEIQDTTTIFGNSDFVFPVLSENAKPYITQWGAFEDFEDEAKSISKSNIEDLRDNSERLIARIDSLSKGIPDTLKTQAIISRVMVAKTRALLLRQEAFKSRSDSASLEVQIREMNMAAKNLIIQINEKFMKDDIDFQRRDDEKKELEKQQRFLDSVYQAELKDQNPG